MLFEYKAAVEVEILPISEKDTVSGPERALLRLIESRGITLSELASISFMGLIT